MAKLWDKGAHFNPVIERFTVGNDYLLDKNILPADSFASIAHARGLCRAGLLTDAETEALERELRVIFAEAVRGEFAISPEDEDGHTAIENRLTERLGDTGKKIHTGRSRNDQVLTALRLYMRSFLVDMVLLLGDFSVNLLAFAKEHQKTPMPGRTHFQVAMPSSVGLWASAFAEEIVDSMEALSSFYPLIDRSPLGSAAGYGSSLPLDRTYVANLMGFSALHVNVIAAGNDRGRSEARLLAELEMLLLSLGKFSTDLILFSLPEFGYFSLPEELCSGSSIMPQKKNPDGLEILRGSSAAMAAYARMARGVVRSLPSGYNRDFQLTKEPLLRGSLLALDAVTIANMTIEKLTVHSENLSKAFTPDIYATDAAYDLVVEGMPFRDAYRKVGTSLEELSLRNPEETIFNRTSEGTAGNLCVELIEKRRATLVALNSQRIGKIEEAVEKLTRGKASLCSSYFN